LLPELLIRELQAPELALLLDAHLVDGSIRRIERGESLPGGPQQGGKLHFARRRQPIRLEFVGPASASEPAADAVLLDHCREGLVELAVAGDVQALVRELVEDRADEA